MKRCMQPNNQIQTIVPVPPVDSEYTLFASLTPQEGWEQRKQSFRVDCDELETEEEEGKKEEPKKRLYSLERQKAFRNIKEARPALATTQLHQCHCAHLEHWCREILRVLLRVEENINDIKISKDAGSETTEHAMEELQSDTSPYIATSSDELSEFFGNKELRFAVAKKMRSAVTHNKRKSVKQILLRLAPSSVWKNYSKNGQRGKQSAVQLGVLDFIIQTLNLSQVRDRIQKVSLLIISWVLIDFNR